jgi:hypothetical protein
MIAYGPGLVESEAEVGAAALQKHNRDTFAEERRVAVSMNGIV